MKDVGGWKEDCQGSKGTWRATYFQANFEEKWKLDKCNLIASNGRYYRPWNEGKNSFILIWDSSYNS